MPKPAPRPQEGIWTVKHHGHLAWYQRALVPGDFAPGLRPVADYVVEDDDGKAAAWYAEPVCRTCKKVAPRTEELDVLDDAGRRPLARFRTGAARWPKPTAPGSCIWCQTPGAAPVCRTCAAYLVGK